MQPCAPSSDDIGTVTRFRKPGAKSGRAATPQDSLSPAAAAFAAFQTLHGSCGTANQAITSATWGPFSLGGECSYDCGFKEQTWWWKNDYTNWVENQIMLPAVAGSDLAATFATAFQPTQQWLNTDLAGYGATVTSALNTILQVDAAIVQAGGQETPAQAQALSTAFAAASQAVASSLAEINQALQNLASWVSWEQGQAGYPQTAAANAKSSFDTVIVNCKMNVMGQLSCGTGDCENQFNGVQNTVDASFGSLASSLTALNAQFTAALNAASLVAGCMINVQEDHVAVSTQITQAQTFPPTSPIRTIHVNEALANWTTVVTDAQSYFSS